MVVFINLKVGDLMKTIYLVMRHDYETEPIIAFDKKENAEEPMCMICKENINGILTTVLPRLLS